MQKEFWKVSYKENTIIQFCRNSEATAGKILIHKRY